MTKYPKGTIVKLISDTRWLVGRLTQDVVPQTRGRVSCGITRFIVHADREGELYHTDGHELRVSSEQELLRFKDLVKKGMDLDDIYREYKSSLLDEQATTVRAAVSLAEDAVIIDNSLDDRRQEVLEELTPGEWPVADEPAKIDPPPSAEPKPPLTSGESSDCKEPEPEAEEPKEAGPSGKWVLYEDIVGQDWKLLVGRLTQDAVMVAIPEEKFGELLTKVDRLSDTVEKVAADKSIEVVRALLKNGQHLQDVLAAALDRVSHLEKAILLTKGDVLTFLCSHEMTKSSSGSSLAKFADDFLVWFNGRISK